MKHLVAMSNTKPRQAATFGDIICEVNQAMTNFMEFTGANKPAKDFAEDRCNLPD